MSKPTYNNIIAFFAPTSDSTEDEICELCYRFYIQEMSSILSVPMSGFSLTICEIGYRFSSFDGLYC